MKTVTKKGILSLLLACLLASCLLVPAIAEEAAREEEGPLAFTLPEDATIVPGKEFESYVIAWEPLEDTHAYWIGAYHASSVWEMIGGGWMGSGYIADGSGESYMLNNIIFDGGDVLKGDAVEYDIVEIANAFCALDEKRYSDDATCNLQIVIIPQSGEPVVQIIELPYGLEEPAAE